MAMSMAERGVNRSKASPECGGGSGTSTARSSPPAPSTEAPGPSKKPSTGTVSRRASGVCRLAVAPRAMSGGAVSADGEALHRLPPTLAMFLNCSDPTTRSASRMEGNRSPTAAEVSRSRMGVQAPSRSPSPGSQLQPDNSGIRFRFTRPSAPTTRRRNCMTMSVPPASGLRAPFPSRNSPLASSTVAGSK